MHEADELRIEARVRETPRWQVAIGLLEIRQRVLFVLLTAGRVAVGACDLALAGAMYLLFVLLQGRSPAHESWWIPATVLKAALLGSCLLAVRAAADIASTCAVFQSIQGLYLDFLLRLTHGYNELRWARYTARNRSELLHHALHTSREAADFYHRCIELMAGMVVIAGMAAACVCQSPPASLAFACVLVLFYVLHRLFIREGVYNAASNREASLTRLQNAVANLFSAGKEIRAYGNQSFFSNRIRREAQAFAAQHRRAIFLPQVSRIATEQGIVLLFLALIAYVAFQRGDTRQMLSLLAFYFVLSRRLLPLISQIFVIVGQMESSYENVKMLDAELAECRDSRAPVAPAQLPHPEFVLELNHVDFWFHQNEPVLCDINLAIRKGEIVVLHGASGIGKSSLLNVIAGILPQTRGEVRVDRASIAYVPQEVFLLDDSIRSNILFGLPARSDEELMRALAVANLADFVSARPAGLDTLVGDNGALLSGGQRQRLGLARAVLRGCQLLLLDEATVAIDPENERQVLANLTTSGAAILLVTHRRQACSFAQRVYRLCDGSLVEDLPSRSEAISEHAGSFVQVDT